MFKKSIVTLSLDSQFLTKLVEMRQILDLSDTSSGLKVSIHSPSVISDTFRFVILFHPLHTLSATHVNFKVPNLEVYVLRFESIIQINFPLFEAHLVFIYQTSPD